MSRRLRLLPAVLVAAALAGCMTGERPTLGAPADIGGAPGSTTGNVAVDEVLTRLESTEHPTFTATYGVTRKLDPNSTDAVVAQDGAATSITLGDVRFLRRDSDQTCSISEQRCEDGILEARISDYSIGSGFYASSPARALRVAYQRRSAEPTATQETIAGVAATCVQVPVGTGVETYCATPAGPIARWDTAAVAVELKAFQDTVDPAAFIAPGG